MLVWGAMDLLRETRDCGLAAALPRGGESATRRLPRFLLLVIGSCAVLLCATMTRREIRFWKGSETLFSRAIAVTRNNYMAHFYLGSTYDSEGKLEPAIAEFQEALRLRPNA